MKWIKLFEEFDDSDMSITAFFEELGLEGEYKFTETDGVKFYMTRIPEETNNEHLLDAIEVLEQRLGDCNMSVLANCRIDRIGRISERLTLVIYDKRTLTQTIDKWIQKAHSSLLDRVDESEDAEKDFTKELVNELELVDSVKVDSVRTSTHNEKLFNTRPFLGVPHLIGLFHISLNIDYGKGPDGIWHSDLEYYISELRWSLVDMLKTELDLPENDPTMLGLFKLEKINI